MNYQYQKVGNKNFLPKDLLRSLSQPVTNNNFSDARRLHEFMYIKNIDSNVEVEKYISMLRNLIISFYLDTRACFDMNPNALLKVSRERIDESINTMGNFISYILLKFSNNSGSFRFKVKGDKYVMYFDIAGNANASQLIVTKFDEETKVCTIIPIFVYRNDTEPSNHTFTSKVILIFYITKREKDLKETFTRDKFIESGNITRNTYITINQALLTCILGYEKIQNDDYLNFNHSFLEINTFKLVKSKLKPEVSVNSGYYKVFKSYNINNDHDKNYGSENISMEFIERSSNNNIPIVSLNEKEWNCIDKYMDKQYPDHINLTEALTQPRYGNILTFRYIYDKDDIHEESLLNIAASYSAKNDVVIVYIFNGENNTLDSQAVITITNASNFKGYTNVLSLTVYIQNKKDLWVSSIEEIKRNVPNVFFDTVSLQELMLKFICLQVALYDRPERVRKVTTVKKKNETGSGSNKVYKTPDSKTDFVIEHVLMTKKDASEYIGRISGERKNIEYVLETWLRKGHYKHNRKGELIWIEPKMYHRRLPLAEKDIVIKL